MVSCVAIRRLTLDCYIAELSAFPGGPGGREWESIELGTHREDGTEGSDLGLVRPPCLAIAEARAFGGALGPAAGQFKADHDQAHRFGQVANRDSAAK